MRRGAGFTLIELLVAISILAIVAVLGWRGLGTIVQARGALTGQMEATRGMQLAFAQMESDLEHLADDKLVNGRPFLLAGDDRLTLVRKTHIENQPTRLQVVAYRLRDGVLARSESNPTGDLIELDALWQAAASGIGGGATVPLQANLGAMSLENWEPDGWRPSNPNASGAVLRPPMTGAIVPTGLRVSLQVPGQGAPMVKSFLLGGR
ncbi:PulJ/GspJ family protein [Massilia glaciei]|uniref:Prepilin-type N-terminal cleavage/methylation domain-containing protein n=1 Tax=Massilia glaciei TaxID=1524097 RepID=A0A2U2I4R8_9BURK|nr:prepilin-type N-terminal cleavage/methylation domain-containing protein [Massilia glaciei]PWF54814.1 prepilin-type N-terminal cleavage/methylation domain-containing protein [Massilia glaciei]